MLKRLEIISKSLEKHQYICYGLEIGSKSKIKHIQGYIELKGAQRLTFLQNYFNLQKNNKKLKFHIEPAKGSCEENQKYTQKDGKWYEFGKPKQKGRSDLVELKNLVSKNPKEIGKIIKENCTNNQQLRFVENLQKYYFEDRDRKRPSTVLWIYGESGIGKSKLVYDSFDSVHSVSDCKWPGDKYAQQECFLLDDFRENDLPFNVLLKIIDRYPFSLQYKGGFIPLNSPYIVITSPKSIVETFSFLSKDEDLEQIRRRVFAEINLEKVKISDLKKYIGENKS